MREKVGNLRMGLQLLGTQNTAFWASWTISASFMALFVCFEMIIIGKYLFKFDVFVLTPFWAMGGLLFTTCLVYISMASFFSTLFYSRA